MVARTVALSVCLVALIAGAMAFNINPSPTRSITLAGTNRAGFSLAVQPGSPNVFYASSPYNTQSSTVAYKCSATSTTCSQTMTSFSTGVFRNRKSFGAAIAADASGNVVVGGPTGRGNGVRDSARSGNMVTGGVWSFRGGSTNADRYYDPSYRSRCYEGSRFFGLFKPWVCDNDETDCTDTSCLAGTSVAISHGSTPHIVAGMPYALGSDGALMSVSYNTPVVQGKDRESGILELDWVTRTPVDPRRRNAQYTLHSVSRYRYYDYLGYTVYAEGDINGDGRKDVLAAAPRHAYYNGEVVAFWGKADGSVSTSEGMKLKGSQMGAYFGHAITVGDFNGDGKADIAIGAPHFIHNGVYDAGEVSVYNGKVNNDVSPSLRIYGEEAGARFGYSLTNSDFNNDGFSDLIVGSPLFGRSSAGVYGGRITYYRGSPSGLLVSSPQHIDGTGDRRYGWSLSAFTVAQPLLLSGGGGGSDNKVFVFDTLPVATLSATVATSVPSVDSLEAGKENVRITVTLTNSGPGVVDAALDWDVELDGRYDLVSKSPSSARVNLAKDSSVNLVVEVKTNSVENPKSQLQARFSWTKAGSNYALNEDSVMTIDAPVPFNTGCAGDNCRADVAVAISNAPAQIVAGTSVNFLVTVQNNGPEFALKPELSIDIGDPNLEIRVLRPSVSCVRPQPGATVIKCSPPIQKLGASETYTLTLSTNNVQPLQLTDARTVISAEVTTTSVDVNNNNNDASAVLQYDYSADVQIVADTSIYKDGKTYSDFSFLDFNKRTHRYLVSTTTAGSPALDVKVKVFWPQKFLFLGDVEVEQGDCNIDYVNCNNNYLILSKSEGFENTTVNMDDGSCDYDPLKCDCSGNGDSKCCRHDYSKYPVPGKVDELFPYLYSPQCLTWADEYVCFTCTIPSVQKGGNYPLVLTYVPNYSAVSNMTFDNTTWAPSYATVSSRSEEKLTDANPGLTASVKGNNEASFNSLAVVPEQDVEKGNIGSADVQESSTPIWAIPVGLLLGLLLAAAIVYVLYRKDFFKRQNKPPEFTTEAEMPDDAGASQDGLM